MYKHIFFNTAKFYLELDLSQSHIIKNPWFQEPQKTRISTSLNVIHTKILRGINIKSLLLTNLKGLMVQ